MIRQLILFISLALSFTIVYFVIPKIIKVSRIKGLFDVPNHRSANKKIVPTLGGIAIFAGFTISTIVSSFTMNIDALKYLFVGVIVMFLVGMKDDIIGLSATKKFLFQFGVSLILVTFGGYRISHLHGLLGIQEIGYFMGVILSVVTFVGIINALNLIDGIDGLAGGVGLLISFVYGFWFLNAGDILYALVCFSLAGSLIAFLLYNIFGQTNKIFMGDTGSLIIGIIIATLTIHFNTYQNDSRLAVDGLPALSLAILIVPIIDTLRVFALRIAQKRSPFSADMNHIHHDLLRLTGNHLISSLIAIAANGMIIWISFLLIDEIGNNFLFFLLLISGFILASVPGYIYKLQTKEDTVKDKKSIFAFTIFTKNLKS